MEITCAKFGSYLFWFGQVSVEFLVVTCVCSLRSVAVRNSQVQLVGAGAFTGQTCVCSCRLEPAPSLCLLFGTAVSSRQSLVGRVRHLCFQAPISAHPGTRALTAPRAGAEQFTLIEFVSSSWLLLISFSIGNLASFFHLPQVCRVQKLLVHLLCLRVQVWLVQFE
jgi:hypothetical protein